MHHRALRARLGFAMVAVIAAVLVAACGSSSSSSSSCGRRRSRQQRRIECDVELGRLELERRIDRHVVVRAEGRASGHRDADQYRHDRHQAAGHGLQRRPEHDQRVLRVRERQRRRQRPSGQAVRRVRPDAAGADRGGGQEADPDRPRGRDRRRVRPARVHDRPGVLEAAGHLRDGRGHRAGVLVDAATARRSTWARATARTAPCSTASAQKPYEDRVRAVKRAWYRLHRRRADRSGQGRRRADHGADRERADQRRQLGGTGSGQQGRLERLGGAELHPAGGAGDPAGRPEARPRGSRQGLGLLDPVQHGLPGQLAGTEVEPQAVRQRRADLARRSQRAGDAALQGDPRASTARPWPVASARSARWATCSASSAVDALQNGQGSVHDPERQPGVQEHQGPEDRAAVPAVGVR